MKEVYIVSATRTPIGGFGGHLSSITAPKLGSFAIREAVSSSGIDINQVDEVLMGNVLQANLGQAPARQAAILSGLSENVPCTTINKVCSSGMKAIMLGAQSILTGDNDIVVAGGMENMSAVPYYLDKVRNGYRLGNGQIIDGLVSDGLTDAYDGNHMGLAAELCAENNNISRKDQDNYAIESYQRSSKAWSEGKFGDEVCSVEVPQRKGDPKIIDTDEEFTNVNLEKIPNLRTVFKKDGTVTAGNASTLNDGAAALVLMSKDKADELGIKPLAKILAHADAAQEPVNFTTAPSKAIPIALKKARITISDVDYFEINEAFSVVSLANNQLLNLDPAKVNVNGGAVSLGHPLGCSGARIIVTLINVLKQNKGMIGVAGICNGGGGASAIVIELM
ncbi:MAG: acetyl-CoA C-acyltransferase [Flavobacteriales bacterium]|nr:acetyl-CoA C-acyltransferase [Flavobacteriales bacterium]